MDHASFHPPIPASRGHALNAGCFLQETSWASAVAMVRLATLSGPEASRLLDPVRAGAPGALAVAWAVVQLPLGAEAEERARRALSLAVSGTSSARAETLSGESHPLFEHRAEIRCPLDLPSLLRLSLKKERNFIYKRLKGAFIY